MADVNQSPVETVGSPPVLIPEPALPATRPPQRYGLLAGVGLVFVLGLAVWWFVFRDARMNDSSGFADRTSPTVAGMNTVVATKGSCTKSYQLQPAGRVVDGTQHYALTITLVGDPIDQTELYTTLNAANCNSELLAITSAVAPLVAAKPSPTLLVTAYRTKSGKLLFAP